MGNVGLKEEKGGMIDEVLGVVMGFGGVDNEVEGEGGFGGIEMEGVVGGEGGLLGEGEGGVFGDKIGE